MSAENDASNPRVMEAFYRRIFPYRPFFLWLNQDHVPSKLFTHREFAFTLAGDVYLRYNSFSDADDFKRGVLRLIPSRFEIGPQYTARPKDRKTLPAGALQPARRELVFDIDMTDYDEIRTCCSDKKICKRCWGYIAAAVKVLDKTLRETFGYKHLLWVYSGRRGIHCWISDAAALDLNDDQRRALVTFLEVIKGSKEQAKKVSVRGGKEDGTLHPFISQSKEALKANFRSLCLFDQDCFGTERGYENLLALLPSDRETIAALRKKWEASPDRSSAEKWKDVRAEMSFMLGKKDALHRKFECALDDIILQYTYPRIDAEVSKHRNHLLKSPFCVHPGTGRVCVPLNPNKIDQFDPEGVPTVGQLLRELDNVPTDVDEKARREDYDYTSLKPYIKIFEEHVAGILADAKKLRKAAGKEESMEF